LFGSIQNSQNLLYIGHVSCFRVC